MINVNRPSPLIRLAAQPRSIDPFFSIAMVIAIIAPPSAGQDRPASDGQNPKAIVLFDGKSLSGWKKTDFINSGEIKVKDGMIVIATGRSMSGITTTRSDFPATDYELRYEAMRLDGRDFFAAATFPVGKSYITLVNGGWGGGVTGLSSLDGMDASENETTHSVRYQDNKWYRFRVRVTDKMIRCWIDDKEIIAVNHQNRRVGTRIESRRNQPLGFATWESSGGLRGIEIRPLTPTEIAATDKSED
jgi:hypothetical protein